jgi:hypothetical protein
VSELGFILAGLGYLVSYALEMNNEGINGVVILGAIYR